MGGGGESILLSHPLLVMLNFCECCHAGEISKYPNVERHFDLLYCDSCARMVFTITDLAHSPPLAKDRLVCNALSRNNCDLVYTKTVDSVERASRLATQTPDILCYSPPRHFCAIVCTKTTIHLSAGG